MTQFNSDTEPNTLARRGVLVRLLRERLPMFESMFVWDYQLLWVSSTLAMMAMNMQMLTRVWLVMRLMSDSPMAVVYVTMTFAFPMIIVSAFGGALADRLPRRTMMIVGQAGNAGLTFVIGTLDLMGIITFAHLMVVGLLNGSLMAINMPSRQAMISEILPEDKLMNGIALINSGMNLTRILGPALAGLLIVMFGTGGVFYIVAGLYLVSVVVVLPIQSGRIASKTKNQSMGIEIREGFSYALGDPLLRGLIVMAFVPILFGMSYYVLLPAWGREVLDIGSDQLGVLQTMMGVGALFGSVLVAGLSNFRRRGMLILACCVAWGVALILFSGTSSHLIAASLLTFIGISSSICMSINMAMLQLFSLPEMRGRVMSISMMTWGLMPLSAIPFGFIAERYSSADALLISGILLTVFTLVFTLSYPSFRRIE